MKKVVLTLVFSSVALGLAGCLSSSNAETSSQEPAASQVQSGGYILSGLNTRKQTKVLIDQYSYEAELANYTDETPEQLDFSKGKVLLVDMGPRSTGGYSIKVTSTEEHEDYLMASVTLTKPGNGCMVTQAITNPYQFLYIPVLKEILITETLEVVNCQP